MKKFVSSRTLMKGIVSLFGLFLFVCSVSGQEKKAFEGELHYRSLENHDKNMLAFSAGLAYNGSRDIKFIIKGNKTLFRDECLHLTILLDPDKNIVIEYFDLIEKGMQFDYGSYVKMRGSYSKEGPSPIEHNISIRPTLYRFESTGKTIDYLGYNTEFITGRIEVNLVGTSFEIYKVASFEMPKSYEFGLLYGIDIDGLISKFVHRQINNAPKLMKENKSVAKRARKLLTKEDKSVFNSNIQSGEMKGAVYTELKEIIERRVDEAEFVVPQNIGIQEYDAMKYFSLYKENTAYLEEHNMYPSQVYKDVDYKIDEDWDF